MSDATDAAKRGDTLEVSLSARRGLLAARRVIGHGVWELFDEDGNVKGRGDFSNLITDYGDEYYARRATVAGANIVTGMRLGTGATAAAKNGAGAAIVTYVTASNKALDSNPAVSSLGAGLGWRVQYVTTWSPGQATANGIQEAVVTNETPLTNVAGAVGNTLSRAILNPVVNKGAGDTLVITWNHDGLGA